VIGDRCIVGAGALVTPGTQIPAGWLAVGSPARPTRPLREEELAWLADLCGGHGLAPAGEWQKVRSAGKLWRYDKKEFSIWRDAL